MREALWNKKDQQAYNNFLKNTRNIYQELLQEEMDKRKKNVKKIRHLKQVIEELQEINRFPLIKTHKPVHKPVCEGLTQERRKNPRKPSEKSGVILDFLLNHHHKLYWQYGYEKLPEGLQQNFAFGEVVGAAAPRGRKKINLGFVLLSPDTKYPKHIHEGVDELYLNLGGVCQINEKEVFRGESHHVISGLPHDIQSAKNEMGILLYTWVFTSEKYGDYKLEFLDS